MPALVYSAAVVGLDGVPVDVEVDTLRQGLHAFTLVGLPDTAVREARERVGAALKNSGFQPAHHFGRVTVNLAPADLPKNSPMYDLPIALSFLLASGQIRFEPKKKLFVGEVSLDGTVRRVHGILPIALFAEARGFEEIYVPEENAREASLATALRILPVKNLLQVVNHLAGREQITPYESQETGEDTREWAHDFRYIRGQAHAKRALEIAASGGHNVLFVGPPGSGKTLLAKAMPSILPKPDLDERLEVTKIFSVAGRLHRSETLIDHRPFRSPHHTASSVSLVGGGQIPRPGEISLAHRGVLFLDEFAEFSRSVLENLRQPLEDGEVTVSRVQGAITFPARFMLLAAMNPCPCGFYGDIERACSCSPYHVSRYRQKVSGPILDRIDLHVEVPRLQTKEFGERYDGGEPSEAVRNRVEEARDRQRRRFSGRREKINAEMDMRSLGEFCALSDEVRKTFLGAVQAFQLSARGYARTLKVARTIADLAASETIEEPHLLEALQYRFRE